MRSITFRCRRLIAPMISGNGRICGAAAHHGRRADGRRNLKTRPRNQESAEPKGVAEDRKQTIMIRGSADVRMRSLPTGQTRTSEHYLLRMRYLDLKARRHHQHALYYSHHLMYVESIPALLYHASFTPQDQCPVEHRGYEFAR